MLFFTCHRNAVWCYVAVDTVRVYDYMTKNSLCMSRFNAPGSSMLWAPKIVSMLHLSVVYIYICILH